MTPALIVRSLPGGRVEWLDGNTLRQDDLPALAEPKKNRRVILAYPGERVHCLTLQAPARRRTPWLKALPYALEDQTAQDISTLHIITGPIAANGTTPVMLTERTFLAETLALLHDHGIDPIAVVPDFLLLPRQPDQWTVWADGERMLVHLDERAGFVCERDNLVFCLHKALAEMPAQPECVRLIGDLDFVSELKNLRLEAEPAQNFSKLAVTESTLFNLRRGIFARNKTSQRWWRQWRAVALLAGLSLALAFIQNLWYWRQLETEKTRLQAAIEQTFRSVLPAARLVNPRAQMEAQLRHNGQNDPAADQHFLPLLGIAAQVLQAHSVLELRGVSFRQGLLELDLTGGSLEQLDTLKAQLAQNPTIRAEVKASVREGQVLSRLGLQFQGTGDS